MISRNPAADQKALIEGIWNSEIYAEGVDRYPSLMLGDRVAMFLPYKPEEESTDLKYIRILRGSTPSRNTRSSTGRCTDADAVNSPVLSREQEVKTKHKVQGFGLRVVRSLYQMEKSVGCGGKQGGEARRRRGFVLVSRFKKALCWVSR